ncbi:hypothetical protein [Catellatospora sichuanensis]|uniref:hypothetical protein n=1 Tax=Catellatospora sichuanensis TaxID=1969805 RepID=UPI00118236F4|nr:hypothetical protein [Catellatospora sichuanensis]
MRDGGSLPWDEAMSGWRSDYVAAPVQLDRQRSRLLDLIGRRVTAGWTGWDPVRDRWFEDIPLVLVFEGEIQLELEWAKWDALSITWNTLDLAVAPKVGGRPHQWRPSAPDAVAAVVGRTVTGFAVTESPYFLSEGGDWFTPGPPMLDIAGWVTSGLWIATGDSGLHVYNGVDANALSSSPTEPDHEGRTRVTPLAAFGLDGGPSPS